MKTNPQPPDRAGGDMSSGPYTHTFIPAAPSVALCLMAPARVSRRLLAWVAGYQGGNAADRRRYRRAIRRMLVGRVQINEIEMRADGGETVSATIESETGVPEDGPLVLWYAPMALAGP